MLRCCASVCSEGACGATYSPIEAMVDYSKWDNLDSDDSDSTSDGEAAAAKAKQQQQPRPRGGGTTPSARKAADDKRQLDQAEALRYRVLLPCSHHRRCKVRGVDGGMYSTVRDV